MKVNGIAEDLLKYKDQLKLLHRNTYYTRQTRVRKQGELTSVQKMESESDLTTSRQENREAKTSEFRENIE